MQYFPPSLSYYLSLRSSFCLFLSCLFTQVLLHAQNPFLNIHADLTIEAIVLTFALSFVCEQRSSKPSCASHRSKLSVMAHLEKIYYLKLMDY